ncbi:hypothetical protein ACIBQ1_35415 [Nonomuraea sp. NPDC050153]|uniref:hypothetical protein n=1 Tax=Nonomuraea sp. NPDC050153 TaxID=3364359 RepID=UPI0037B73AEB
MEEALDPCISELDRRGTWRALSTLRDKFTYFQTDTVFRQSWQTAVDVVGDEALALFQRLAILTVKPDAVLSRKAEACVDYLAAHGFVPIHAELFWYDRAMARELWRFQWNVATLDRIDVTDLMLYRTQAMTIVLLDTSDPLEIPAAPRLIRLKGSAFPSDRSAFQLREVLRAPNRVAVLVHCPDEPMDIVRELGVVFDQPTLANIYAIAHAALRSAVPADLTATTQELYKGTPELSLDVDHAVDGVRTALLHARDNAAATRAAAALQRARRGENLHWRSWAADLTAAGVSPTEWEPVLAASHYIQHDHAGSKTLIKETGRRRWLAGEGLMLGV